MTPATPVRLAHFSDVHVTCPVRTWRREDWLGKRFSAWLNLRLLGRGRRFRHADEALRRLADDAAGRGVERLVFSGDATALGLEEDVAHAAALLRVGERPGLAVPGNHDYCTPRDVREGHFERLFAPWQQGERVGEETYPFAQRVGPLWLVGVSSATPNRWAWDARGAVGEAQLLRLERLLGRLDGGPRVLVTHYPVALASGRGERRTRLLRDLARLIEVAAKGGVGLWLHGHRHDAYHLPAGERAPFPVICAGSGTQTGRWSYGEYIIDGRRLAARRRVYDPAAGAFSDGEAFELELTGAG